ncbi:MAG TPA: DUF1990 domain-containing protein [Pyrinomonadaceae bacterium]|nr:DUF1990 domain-containing protein [Pyrinomonadaceae bacterium]
MFLLRKPTEATVEQFIAAQRNLPFSYSEVGATNHRSQTSPAGYTLDHNRTRLGDGEQTYNQAIAALRSWKQFGLGWVSVVPAGQVLDVGTTVAVQAETFGFWSLSAARIVYLIDEEQDGTTRFGFAYGTLPDHVETGEERFTVERLQDGSVWYDIYAFSRPRHPLVRLGYPLTRMLQKRFARDSMAVMRGLG